MFSSNSSQVSSAAVFVEEIFQTYLYTGTGASQTITNNIDLSTYGGLVWNKPRTAANYPYGTLTDTARGVNRRIIDSLTDGEYTNGPLSAFNSNGFTINSGFGGNTSSDTYASWTFREQPKFFDIVTYTGTGSNTTIAHSLGSVPGSIIVKRTDTTAAWAVYHRSLANTQYMVLNTTAAAATGATRWNSTTPTSAVFSVGTDASVNASGGTYVAYLFAHDAGGFGLTGTDNVISCGSFTTDGSGNGSVTLGYEPQFLITKGTDGGTNWNMVDTMRGATADGVDSLLRPNLSNAEISASNCFKINSTGFSGGSNILSPSTEIIYIAIRRGPMKVPTLGTSVFAPLARTGSGTNPTVVTTGTNPDLLMSFPRTASPAAYGTVFFDKLRGVSQILQSANTNAEATTAGTFCLQSFLNTGFQTGADFIQGYLNYSGSTYAQYAMTRAPGFFDEVCYTGTGSNTTVSHNLTVAPEMVIIKSRSTAYAWPTLVTAIGNYKFLFLDTDGAQSSASSYFNNTYPTASVFSVGTNVQVNGSGATFVAYLFATCAGVSKVGSYTGNGSTQTIDCGFGAGGARFVLIKRYDDGSTGDWYTYDTARGMTVLTDPYLRLNLTAAETATLGSVTTVSTGFALNSAILAAINVSAGSYIFLAIA